MDTPTKEILIKEYEVAQTALNSQNAIAWQIGTIIIGVSIGAFSLVAQSTLLNSSLQNNSQTPLIVFGIGFISWVTLYLWFIAYRRWGTFVEIAHRRMHEIEHELGMWKNRYVEIVDSEIQKRKIDSPDAIEADSANVKAVIEWARLMNKRGRLTASSVDVTIRRIVAVFLFAWLSITIFTIPSTYIYFEKWYLLLPATLVSILWSEFPRIKRKFLIKSR